MITMHEHNDHDSNWTEPNYTGLGIIFILIVILVFGLGWWFANP